MAFLISHELATVQFVIAVALAGALVALLRRERTVAILWILLGLLTGALFSGIKVIVGRPRPALWPRLVAETGYAFPSGHAMASAALYPFLAYLLAVRFPRGAPFFWALGLALPLYVGFGRLYLGVHWPTDVLAGWGIGALQSGLAIAWLRRSGYPARVAEPPASPRSIKASS